MGHSAGYNSYILNNSYNSNNYNNSSHSYNTITRIQGILCKPRASLALSLFLTSSLALRTQLYRVNRVVIVIRIVGVIKLLGLLHSCSAGLTWSLWSLWTLPFSRIKFVSPYTASSTDILPEWNRISCQYYSYLIKLIIIVTFSINLVILVMISLILHHRVSKIALLSKVLLGLWNVLGIRVILVRIGDKFSTAILVSRIYNGDIST